MISYFQNMLRNIIRSRGPTDWIAFCARSVLSTNNLPLMCSRFCRYLAVTNNYKRPKRKTRDRTYDNQKRLHHWLRHLTISFYIAWFKASDTFECGKLNDRVGSTSRCFGYSGMSKLLSFMASKTNTHFRTEQWLSD